MVSKKKDVFDDPLRIRFRGVYDYDGLMSLIRDFYASVLIDIKEPKFKFKNGGAGAEVEFKFEGDRKVTHYIKIHLFVSGHIWDVKREEMTVDGVKRLMTKGKLEVLISGKVESDYANGFSSGKKPQELLEKWMQSTLDAPGTGLQYGDNKMIGSKFMEKMLQRLASEIKKFLKMECY